MINLHVNTEDLKDLETSGHYHSTIELLKQMTEAKKEENKQRANFRQWTAVCSTIVIICTLLFGTIVFGISQGNKNKLELTKIQTYGEYYENTK